MLGDIGKQAVTAVDECIQATDEGIQKTVFVYLQTLITANIEQFGGLHFPAGVDTKVLGVLRQIKIGAGTDTAGALRGTYFFPLRECTYGIAEGSFQIRKRVLDGLHPIQIHGAAEMLAA